MIQWGGSFVFMVKRPSYLLELPCTTCTFALEVNKPIQRGPKEPHPLLRASSRGRCTQHLRRICGCDAHPAGVNPTCEERATRGVTFEPLCIKSLLFELESRLLVRLPPIFRWKVSQKENYVLHVAYLDDLQCTFRLAIGLNAEK
jgi:hypothetical protein